MLRSAFMGLSVAQASLPVAERGTQAETPAPPKSGNRYFVVFLPYRFWKRSTRPAVSTNFCVPVKNGWHFEQMPMRMSLRVDFVLMMLPHAQWITASTYSGCILAFMKISQGGERYRSFALHASRISA